ncbi:MAG: single-stranded-DNA-specific exonuclease RecJ [Alphaproteobacteria bacterium]|nr:single-stranded-DNA-specific exonuclease RecJ [Alphaproteobacteria bacterium]MBV9374268.1 single-stranded-DNA-specific exonuclease RecJ [Alphaproteobacteria bacterium]
MNNGAGGADELAGVVLGVERSVCGRRWHWRRSDTGVAEAIAQRLGLPEIVGRLLAQRGIDVDHAPGFLAPRLRDQLPDPSHLRDMDAAVVRLVRAVRDGETIGIFGDYDVDGATSAALLTRFFAATGTPTRIYVPDRLREGYGPNAPALLRLREEGVRVVVTVDCGTTAHLPLAEAGEAGLDAIVIDHHVAEPLLPRAAAVVNPNRLDETSPHGALAAVGVAFLLVVAVNRELRRAGWYGASRTEPDLLQWLDLVALGTVCDVVPLAGLNRALVAQGIKVARRRDNPGLAALAAVAGIGEPIDAYHLGFMLGPRVNAGGRVGAADLGARLLATEDPGLAAELAARLDAFNRERREIEARTLEAAIAVVEASAQSPVLVFAAAENWHPGVIGIVAARLRERYERPTCVVALADGIGRGSGRSVPALPLGPAVIAARQAGLLINGGGHAMAAGFTVAEEKLAALESFLIERLGDGMKNERLIPELRIDGTLSAVAAQGALVDHIATLAPFGAANPEPRFAFPGVRVTHAEPVGNGHLRCTLADPLDDARLRAVAFRVADTPLGRFLVETRGAAIHVAGHLTRDMWRGGDAVQLTISDAAPAIV